MLSRPSAAALVFESARATPFAPPTAGRGHPLRDRIVRLALWLTWLTEGLGAALLFVVIAINMIGVFFRFVINDPIGWTEEIMRYLVVWATFLAASAALFRGEHMTINVFENFPIRWLRRAIHVIALLCVGAMCVVMILQGYPLAIKNAGQLSPTMQILMMWPYLAIPVAGTLMLIKVVALLMMPMGVTAADLERGETPEPGREQAR